MLPPLIIEEAEIADAIGRIDRAAERVERAQRDKQSAAQPAPREAAQRAVQEAAGVKP
jgi:hypothetical protein